MDKLGFIIPFFAIFLVVIFPAPRMKIASLQTVTPALTWD